MKQRSAEIAGAGLAGLAVATRLAQLGWKVRLHERSADLRMFGAGIWLWNNGLKSLKILGAYDAAVRRAKTVKEWRICDGQGRLLMSRPANAADPLLIPPRADLYEALIDRAEAAGVEILTSSVVAGARPEGVLVLEDGTEHRADLVIAADGANSRIREAVQCTSWIDYGRGAGIRMLASWSPDDPDDTCIEYWSGPWRFLYNPCTDGETYFALLGPLDDERGRRVPIDREFWREKFPAAGRFIDRLVEDGRWDRLINIRCRKWSVGRLAIIGDAAHAMPPNLGQAANMAFTNAMALAAIVDAENDVPTALVDWEKRQRPLTDHVQWWSYIYDAVLLRWPLGLTSLRSDVLRMVSKTEWFEDGLNRGARHVPMGYRDFMDAQPRIGTS